MKIAIISLGGKSSVAVGEACKKYFGRVDMLNIKDFEVTVNGGVRLSHLKEKLGDYDCVYVRGSYRYAMLQRAIARALQSEVYMPIRSRAFAIGHDKFLTLLELQKKGVAIPRTHYVVTKKNALKILEKEIDYPVIIKVPEGTHGRGVLVAESFKSARTILDMLEEFKKPYIIQEFVQTEKTSDIRAIVCGKKVVASYQRVASEGEFRANIHSGGKRQAHSLTEEQERLAIESAGAIGCDVCGVDILNSEKPSVIEVNLSPSVYSLSDFSDEEVPDKIAHMLRRKAVRFKKRQREKERKKLRKLEKKSLK